jgi:hypothetical protein
MGGFCTRVRNDYQVIDQIVEIDERDFIRNIP